MGIPDGAHTHGHGGSGPGGAIVLIIAVALPGPPVAAAAVLHVLVIVAAVIVGVGATSLVGLLVWRWRRLAAARAIPPRSRSGVPAPWSDAGRSAAPSVAARDRAPYRGSPAPARRVCRRPGRHFALPGRAREERFRAPVRPG